MKNNDWLLLKDKHKSETAIIIGNGPSLNDVSLSFLWGKPTFGCNRIDLFDGLVPTYYSVMGEKELKTPERRDVYKDTIRSVDAAFIHAGFSRYFEGNIYSLRGMPGVDGYSYIDKAGLLKRQLFSKDPDIWIGVAFTQTYINLQLAYFMGFETVLLVGIDHDYGSENRHFYPDKAAGVLQPDMKSDDANIYTANMADLAYMQARGAFEARGGGIINLTPNSKSKAFKRRRLSDYE